MSWFDLDLASTPFKTLRYPKKAIRKAQFHAHYPLMSTCSDDGTVHIFHDTVYNDFIHNALIVPLKVLRGHKVTGDLGVCEQAKRLCPTIYTVPVSRGCGNGSISIHPAEAVKRIREKAELAVADGIAHPDKFTVALPNNFDVEVEFVKHNRARRASFYPGVKQTGPRSVRFSSDAYFDVLRFFMFCL